MPLVQIAISHSSFVSFLVEVEPDETLPKTGLSIGIDVGLKSFITLMEAISITQD
ncbi:MAG: hypothetical protein ACE14P_08430 [Methanotrichaceae archaeon]